MARHKKLKPVDHKFLRAKKREKIRKAVDYTYIAIMLIGILVCGLNQFNDTIVGWGFIIMGVISVPVAVFDIYVSVCGWKPLFWYDEHEIRDFISSETREQDCERHVVIRWIENISLIIFSIWLPIEGILKLIG